jgi:hypothetical protein
MSSMARAPEMIQRIEDSARLLFDEVAGGVAAFGVEQVRGFPRFVPERPGAEE